MASQMKEAVLLPHKHRLHRTKRDKEDGTTKLSRKPCTAVKTKDTGEDTLNQSSIKMKPSIDSKLRSSMKEEIIQLETKLKDQLVERWALEKALGNESSTSDCSELKKPTEDLIREIAVLELEVSHMEQYLLSLYRKAFNAGRDRSQKKPNTDEDVNVPNKPSKIENSMNSGKVSTNIRKDDCGISTSFNEPLAGPGVHRSQSALSYRSGRISPPPNYLSRALQSTRSRPLSFVKDEHQETFGIISLAEYLGTTVVEHFASETLNTVSEGMVRCMGAIFSKLVDNPLVHPCISSPNSSHSSISVSSPQNFGDVWSPRCRKESKLDSRLINPFQVEGLKEFSGPYSSMAEVHSIRTDRQRLVGVEKILQNYQSLVYRLETLDPKTLSKEEKLAFWINLHNALIMNAYLERGIPQNNMKEQSLLLKATCIVNGRLISAAAIRSSILRCHPHSTGQWLRTFLSPNMSFKCKDEWRGYALDHPEPLVHFALCSGNHSDPAVRLYSPKRLYQQLKTAQEEYIRATVGIWNEQKILLPKLIEHYAKEKGLGSQGVVDMIRRYLPETLRIAMQRCLCKKPCKIIEWIPHNIEFRYLLAREVLVS